MPTYVLISQLTGDGAETLRKTPDRVLEVNKEVEKMGAKILSQYVLLGPYDFITILEAPDLDTVCRISIEMSSRGSVKIQTLPAIPTERFVSALKKK
jgi:uncharacterized protein with GYD domain